MAVDPTGLTQTGKNGIILVLVGGLSWIGYGGFASIYLLPRGVRTMWGGTKERDEVLSNLDLCPLCLAEKSMAFDWRMKRSEVSCRTCRARWFLHISKGTIMGLQLLNPSSSGKGAELLGQEYNLEFWRKMRLNEEQAKIAAQRRLYELAQAENLEKAGRYEEAAQIYERWEMWEKAGEMRRKAKTTYIVSKSSHLDLNELLQQVKNEGIAAVYKCPNCGGDLKVNRDSTSDSLRECVHCGKEVQTVGLTEFLKSLLS